MEFKMASVWSVVFLLSPCSSFDFNLLHRDYLFLIGFIHWLAVTMPKSSKQSRTGQLREPAEDVSYHSDDSLGSANACAAIATPELSTEDLLKHISDTVAAEARRTESTMNEAFTRFESSLNAKIDNVIKRIEEVAAENESLATAQAEAESRISGLEDDVTPLKKKVAELAKANAQLSDKIMDIENRTRRDNIRLLNLKESTEGDDPISFFEKFIPTLLKLPVANIAIDRAHRGLGVPIDGNPRPVIIKIHRSRDVILIFTAARRLGNLQHDGRPLRIAPDTLPGVRLVRRAFNPVCAELIKRNIRFRMAFPAVLSFEINGVKKSFKDPKEASAFLESAENTEVTEWFWTSLLGGGWVNSSRACLHETFGWVL